MIKITKYLAIFMALHQFGASLAWSCDSRVADSIFTSSKGALTNLAQQERRNNDNVNTDRYPSNSQTPTSP